MVVFSADRPTDKFEVWEHVVVVQADSLREGLKGAVSMSRSVFDDPDYWKALGYLGKPVLYAVPSIYSHDGPERKTSSGESRPLVTNFSTLDGQQLERLKAFHDVLVPVNVVYVEE
jgi:hypothetical protein